MKNDPNRPPEEALLRENGPLISNERLWRALGFTTGAAFRKAKSRGLLAVEVFDVENRRGTFAFTRDVEAWLADLKCGSKPE